METVQGVDLVGIVKKVLEAYLYTEVIDRDDGRELLIPERYMSTIEELLMSLDPVCLSYIDNVRVRLPNGQVYYTRGEIDAMIEELIHYMIENEMLDELREISSLIHVFDETEYGDPWMAEVKRGIIYLETKSERPGENLYETCAGDPADIPIFSILVGYNQYGNPVYKTFYTNYCGTKLISRLTRGF